MQTAVAPPNSSQVMPPSDGVMRKSVTSISIALATMISLCGALADDDVNPAQGETVDEESLQDYDAEAAFLEEIMKAEQSAVGLKMPVVTTPGTEKSKRRRSKERLKQR